MSPWLVCRVAVEATCLPSYEKRCGRSQTTESHTGLTGIDSPVNIRNCGSLV